MAADHPLAKDRHCVRLYSTGARANVHIRFENVAKVFRQDLSDRLVDFLEIASYVFTADTATPRGKKWADDESTEPWGRDLAFIVAVREPDFWNDPRIKSGIEELLGFLSDDRYAFSFMPFDHKPLPDQQSYLDFGDLDRWPFYAPNRVLMFSGGLDSLAGAVETATRDQRAILVSHRSMPPLDTRQKKLFSELKEQFPQQLFHVPVWVNKSQWLGREATQRTRSFLYTALGTLVAHSIGAAGVRFYENGIVSLNLPIAGEVLRARASRTTHPLGLHVMSSLCSAVTDREFKVDNPFVYKTKAEVLRTLATNQADHLIPYTCSCSHLIFQSKKHRHCGKCSQCIDRRFAIVASGQPAHDAESDYVSDVFTGPRADELERAIAVDYARHGIELHRRSEMELAATFNAEISRAVRYEPKSSEAAQKVLAMLKRHGAAITQVLAEKIAENAPKLVDGTLDNTSLVALVVGREAFREEAQPGSSTETRLSEKEAFVQSLVSELTARVSTQVVQALSTAKLDSSTAKAQARKPQKPKKRDTVIFAAILLDLEGMKYCLFLDKHNVKPRWVEDQAPPSYPKGYQIGIPWRKKIQDEKSRAKQRMSNYPTTMLEEVFSYFFREQVAQLSVALRSRNSRLASKNTKPTRAQ